MVRTHIAPDIRKLARRMRNNPTGAERKLWRALREWSPPGANFRRQAPIGRFIADFACHTTKLIIEVDGSQHELEDNKVRDEVRTQWLLSQGYRTLRFDNIDVLKNMRGVMTVIHDVWTERHIAADLTTGSPNQPQKDDPK
jgi:very-short-patch-repair endonuclease